MSKSNSLDITLTDFIYAIVVGAAFQKIDAPVFDAKNAFLFVAFIVVIDDWVLYHKQASKVTSSQKSFTTSLIVDCSVLMCWYFSAVTGAHAIEGGDFPRDFFLFLACFYVLTAIWELVFQAHTKVFARFWSDIGSVMIAVLAASSSGVDSGEWLRSEIILLSIAWFLLRFLAWRKIIFSPS